MSALRYISRDGKMILQQQVPIAFIVGQPGNIHETEYKWQDVPVVEEPKAPYYFVGDIHALHGPQRVIDERLVNKLVEALEVYDHGDSGAKKVLAEYRKHVVKK